MCSRSPVAAKPVLIFDGNCGFCRMWVGFWQSLTGDRVEYIPFQEAAARFPQIPREELGKAVQYIQRENRYSAAEAVFRLLSAVRGYEWMLWAYLHVPAFAPISEWIYSFIAEHRDASYWITRALWGNKVERPTYRTAALLFAKALAVIYLVAFVSFGLQANGLIGARGILPFAEYLRAITTQVSATAVWGNPTLLWWMRSDAGLMAICWTGAALAILAALVPAHGLLQRASFVALFVLYLSVVNAGQIFMMYQWDLLLLEAGFLAIFLTPALPRIWLLQWLAFRLMFESGAIKLLSHDPTWKSLTALSYHYETQPLPTSLAWYMMQAPMWFHKFSTAFTLAAELGLPFLMFGPRRLKQIAALGIIFLQILILLTGNYTCFNWLAIASCLSLLDDSFLAKLRRGRTASRSSPRANRFVSVAVFLFVMSLGTTQLAEMFEANPPGLLQHLSAAVSPFGVVNGYGLFASMTTTRPEISVEGSDDGVDWRPYLFRYKPGPLDRPPPWVAPHQPRLDWQMWFAALSNYQGNPWFTHLILKLLEASPPVLALLEHDPFSGKPPKYIRALVYDYKFTDYATRRTTGAWWKRELKGTYFPPVSLRDRR